MENTEQNGYKNPRMDRVELALEKLAEKLDAMAERQGADHDAFTEEHNKLLTAQILLTDRIDKLAVAQEHTDGNLGVLVKMMDTFIRERGDAR